MRDAAIITRRQVVLCAGYNIIYVPVFFRLFCRCFVFLCSVRVCARGGEGGVSQCLVKSDVHCAVLFFFWLIIFLVVVAFFTLFWRTFDTMSYSFVWIWATSTNDFGGSYRARHTV